MVFQNLCVFVLWMKVASALEGIIVCHISAKNELTLGVESLSDDLLGTLMIFLDHLLVGVDSECGADLGHLVIGFDRCHLDRFAARSPEVNVLLQLGRKIFLELGSIKHFPLLCEGQHFVLHFFFAVKVRIIVIMNNIFF